MLREISLGLHLKGLKAQSSQQHKPSRLSSTAREEQKGRFFTVEEDAVDDISEGARAADQRSEEPQSKPLKVQIEH